MGRKRKLTLVALSIAASASAATATGWAQSVDLIEDRLGGVRRGSFRLGPFYVTPAFGASSGYDSNALSTPDASSDVTARIGPSVLLSTAIGSNAFFEVDQRIDYVYYREQVELRRWLDTTSVRAGFGGRRFLFEVDDQFFDGTGRPTSEFDFPVQQQNNVLNATLTLALGWRHDLRLEAQHSRYRITDGLEAENENVVQERLNRDVERLAATFRRHMTAKTSALAEGFYEQFDFDDASRNAESTGARFGFEFNPGTGDPIGATPWGRAFVSGRFLLGFRSVTPRSVDFVDYTGLIGSADVTFGFGGGHGFQLQYSRDVVPSIFQENWYFVENRWGGSVRFQVTERLSVTPGASFGKNHYPLTADGEELRDEHRLYRLAASFRVTDHWSVGGNLDYLSRDSNVVIFGKERLQAGFNLAFQP